MDCGKAALWSGTHGAYDTRRDEMQRLSLCWQGVAK